MRYTRNDLDGELEEIAKLPIPEERKNLKANWLRHLYSIRHDRRLIRSSEDFERFRRWVICQL